LKSWIPKLVYHQRVVVIQWRKKNEVRTFHLMPGIHHSLCTRGPRTSPNRWWHQRVGVRNGINEIRVRSSTSTKTNSGRLIREIDGLKTLCLSAAAPSAADIVKPGGKKKKRGLLAPITIRHLILIIFTDSSRLVRSEIYQYASAKFEHFATRSPQISRIIVSGARWASTQTSPMVWESDPRR
jgi:hypothetical protein